MTIEDFWALIDDSSTMPKNERAEWLSGRLAGMSLDDIIDFETHLAAQRKRVDTWVLWSIAGRLMEGFCSTDSFFYFQPWLVGLGRATFERVAADPDALADVPAVRQLAARPVKDWPDEEWPEWESLNYVALEAYEQVTGEEGSLDDALEARGLERVCDPEPDGENWDFETAEDRTTRFPRLTALLG